MLIGGTRFVRDLTSNVTPVILERLKTDLLRDPKSPIKQTADYIFSLLNSDMKCPFKRIVNLNPVVSVEDNFDKLNVSKEHVSRSTSDTFYVNKDYVLRTHMTAHDPQLLAMGHSKFVTAGAVFRPDEIDATHMPMFHQMDAVCLFNRSELDQMKAVGVAEAKDEEFMRIVKRHQSNEDQMLMLGHLKQTVEHLMGNLFASSRLRWVQGSFPFTDPSLEVEIQSNTKLGEWVEVLGCGLLHSKVLACHQPQRSSEFKDQMVGGWAFGLGLERIAMIRHAIPDIRLFWSKDARFADQFSKASEAPVQFEPFSPFPCVNRDVSFYIDPSVFDEQLMMDHFKNHDELVESVEIIDRFQHPDGRFSVTARVVYRSMTRTLTDDKVNSIHQKLRDQLMQRLSGILALR